MLDFYQGNWLVWLLIIWSIPWKMVAVWKAAKLSQKYWFIALFLLNTIGILDILYIFVISKKKAGNEKVLPN